MASKILSTLMMLRDLFNLWRIDNSNIENSLKVFKQELKHEIPKQVMSDMAVS